MASFTPREGCAVFVLDDNILHGNDDEEEDDDDESSGSSALVGIWGGRKGPQQPLNDFLIYEHHANNQNHNTEEDNNKSRILAPIDVRGERPKARWGHSLTRLKLPFSYVDDGKVHRLAVLVGGRNERGALHTVHVLSVIVPSKGAKHNNDNKNGSSSSGHFLWETISFPTDLPSATTPTIPFHHATVVLPDDHHHEHEGESLSVAVFVFGGHSNPCNLLEAFSPWNHDDGPLLDESEEEEEETYGHFVSAISLSSAPGAKELKVRPCKVGMSATLNQDFGVGGAISFLEGLTSQNQSTILWSGGVPLGMVGNHQDASKKESSSTLELLDLAKVPCEVGSTEMAWMLMPSSSTSVPRALEMKLRESVMVHHSMLAIPSTEEKEGLDILLLGGGVMGFAFGPCFSRCYQVRFRGVDGQLQVDTASPTTSTYRQEQKSRTSIPTRKETYVKVNTNAKASLTDVVYVRKRNAKTVKTTLESLSLLDKRFRMGPVTPVDSKTDHENGKEIAVPITACAKDMLRNESPEAADWVTLVEGVGRQEMPYSTAIFASKKKSRKG